MKIAGLVVLYNPCKNIIFNINTYINDIDILYVVDNSDEKKYSLINILLNNNKVVYIDNKHNKGLAYALNVGTKKAIKKGYNWLLTMDQDSYVDKDMISQMVKYIKENKYKKLGIIAPYPLCKFEKRSKYNTNTHEMIVITSGNLLNLDAYKNIGDFNNKLFIDQVDTEYCLRLKLNNYEIVMVHNALLYHNLGDIESKNGIMVFNHNHIRKYYIVRNSLHLIKEYKKYYPNWFKEYQNKIWEIFIILPLLYEKNKFKNFIAIIRGYVDFKLNRYGKYKYKF